jgi:hypothetical protein
MVGHAENMLACDRRLAEATDWRETALLNAQIEATDRQIDRLVRELRGLTEEEVAIVEDAAAR